MSDKRYICMYKKIKNYVSAHIYVYHETNEEEEEEEGDVFGTSTSKNSRDLVKEISE